jgi:cytochrome c-type biogenesis protein CcsB
MIDMQALSVAALWGATILYAVAMVAYSIRLAAEADARVQVKRLATVGAGAGAASGGEDLTATPLPQRARKALGIARSATLVGFVLNVIGVIARGIEAGHVPWSNMYEYTISGSMVAVGIFLGVQRKRDVTFLGAGITGLATIAMGLGLTVLYAEPESLPPALQSMWLIIHVSIATICSGIFGVAFIVTSLQLLKDYRDSGTPRTQWARGRTLRFLEAVPKADVLEALAFRLIAVGFVLWTFTVMAGAIWAEHAWGRYWGWDPKEVWSFVIWVVYAAYLHARTTQGWAGRKSAYLALVGFGCLIVNFTLVNYVFQGLHTYAPGQ